MFYIDGVKFRVYVMTEKLLSFALVIVNLTSTLECSAMAASGTTSIIYL